MNIQLFAHGDESTEQVNEGLLSALVHLPTWAAILLIAFLLFGVYVLLEKLRIGLINRVLLIMPLLILLAILYLQHNTFVTAAVLSTGFLAAFFLAFALITSDKKPKDTGKTNSNASKE